MGWKQDAPGCDPCGCSRLFDDFSTDTLADYTQARGTWTIADGELSTTGSDRLIVYDTAGQRYQTISTRFRSPDSAAVTVFAGYQSFGVHYRAIVSYTGDGCGTLKIWRHYASGGGSPTQVGPTGYLDNLQPEDWQTINVCISEPVGSSNDYVITAAVQHTPAGPAPERQGMFGWTGGVTPTQVSAYCTIGTSNQTAGTECGVGTEAAGASTDAVYFDYLSFGDAFSEANEACPQCECDCVPGSDTFDRADSDDVGCLWQENVGVWRVSNNQLVCTSGANGYVKFLPEYRTPNQYNQADVFINGMGSKAFLCLDGTGDTQIRLQLKTGDNNTGALEIATGGSGGDTLVAKPLSISPGVWYQLSFCLIVEQETGTGPPTFYGSVTGPDARGGVITETIEHPVTSIDDEQIGGVGADTSYGAVRFDNYTTASGSGECGSCKDANRECETSGCQDDEIPERFKVSLPAMASNGNCPSCPGMAQTVVVNYAGKTEDGCLWTAAPLTNCADASGRSDTAALSLLLKHNTTTDKIEATVWLQQAMLPFYGPGAGLFVSFWYIWQTEIDRPADCTDLTAALPLDSVSSAGSSPPTMAPVCDATGTSVNIEAL